MTNDVTKPPSSFIPPPNILLSNQRDSQQHNQLHPKLTFVEYRRTELHPSKPQQLNMSSSGNAEGDASTESTPKVVKFIVKMPQQQGKKELELPLSTTVLGAKEKIAELGDTPVERQRLIYSGRVMKNEETLEFYKVTDGTTIHMVKAAAPPASKSSTSASGSARPAVPTNISAGTANTPLAGLTGARYAGHVNLPSADIFGPDGGVCVSLVISYEDLLTRPNRWDPHLAQRKWQTL